MAIGHAKRGQLVDLNSWPTSLAPGQSHAIIVTNEMEVARLVLPAGKSLPDHAITSPIIIHCLKGTIELQTERVRQSISSGQLVHLEAGNPHSINALKDSEVLLTIIKAVSA